MKEHMAKVYRYDDRTPFTSKVYLGTILYNDEDEMNKEMADVISMFYNSCHTVYETIVVR